MMPLSRIIVPAVACIAAFAYTSLHAEESQQAEDPHARHRAMLKQAQLTEAEAAEVDLRDLPMVTRYGEDVRFRTDVIADQIVVIDFIYTTCTTVCPVISAIFQQVQQGLNDRAAVDVKMLSVSVDPLRDTPQRLQAYAKKLHAGDNWIWLTGEKTTVDEVLRGLGAYSPNFEDHPSIVLVGDPQNGTWKRFFGFPSPAKILAAVDEMTASRRSADAAK